MIYILNLADKLSVDKDDLSIYEVLRLFHMTLATGRFTASDKNRTNCNIAWTKYSLKGRYVF